MSTLRSFVFLLYQTLVTPVYAAVMVLLFWIPRVPMYRIAASWCRTNLLGARWICGIRWQAIGRENIPEGADRTPHIVMSKHSSTWETLAQTMYFPPLAYVAKKELLALPFFGWAFRLASPITIDRDAGQDAMVQISAQGRERFAQGFWIILYPEGTRIPVGKRIRYKTGAARLAIEMRVPILPVAHNAGWLWPKGVMGKRPGTVTLSVGKPIAPGSMTAAELMLAVETWIEGEIERMGPPAGAAPQAR